MDTIFFVEDCDLGKTIFIKGDIIKEFEEKYVPMLRQCKYIMKFKSNYGSVSLNVRYSVERNGYYIREEVDTIMEVPKWRKVVSLPVPIIYCYINHSAGAEFCIPVCNDYRIRKAFQIIAGEVVNNPCIVFDW